MHNKTNRPSWGGVLCLGVLAACGESQPNEATLEELLALQREINTTDVSATLHASPRPVRAGDPLLYAISVNNRRNPAQQVRAVITLPSQVSYALGDEACSTAGSIATCNLGGVPADSSRPLALLVNVPASAAGQLLTCQVTVRHYYQAFNSAEPVEGPDPSPQNNTAQVTVPVQ